MKQILVIAYLISGSIGAYYFGQLGWSILWAFVYMFVQANLTIAILDVTTGRMKGRMPLLIRAGLYTALILQLWAYLRGTGSEGVSEFSTVVYVVAFQSAVFAGLLWATKPRQFRRH